MLMYVATVSTLNCVCVFQVSCPFYSSDTHMSYLPLAHMFERIVQVCFLWLIIITPVYFNSILSTTVHVHVMAGSASCTRSQDWFLPRRYPVPVRWPVHTEANGVSCGSTTAQQDVWQGGSLTLTVKRWWQDTGGSHTQAFLHIFFFYWK